MRAPDLPIVRWFRRRRTIRATASAVARSTASAVGRAISTLTGYGIGRFGDGPFGG